MDIDYFFLAKSGSFLLSSLLEFSMRARADRMITLLALISVLMLVGCVQNPAPHIPAPPVPVPPTNTLTFDPTQSYTLISTTSGGISGGTFTFTIEKVGADFTATLNGYAEPLSGKISKMNAIAFESALKGIDFATEPDVNGPACCDIPITIFRLVQGDNHWEISVNGAANSSAPLPALFTAIAQIQGEMFIVQFISNEVAVLAQTTILVAKTLVEFDPNAPLEPQAPQTATIWLYAKQQPTREQVQYIVTQLGTKLDSYYSEYYYNFYFFPADSTKLPGDTQPYDYYYNVYWRNNQVIFPEIDPTY